MENITNLKDSLFIQLGYEEGMPDTLCEVCAGEGEVQEASHDAWGMELCVDCYMDGCD